MHKTHRFILPLVICFLSGFAAAQLQVDAKVNVGSLVTGGINVSADFVLNENMSLAAGLAHATTGFGITDGAFRYRTARFIPEFRYYVSPNYSADRLFLGAYGKVVAVKAEDIDDDESVNGVRGVIGLLLGYKWVTSGGVVIELNAGAGRGTFFGSGTAADEAFGIISRLDLRLGILVGYRF